jgi:ribosome-binding protein aMBF1 (putative translation factor)
VIAGALGNGKADMSDLQRYTKQRARQDEFFTQTFEAGYTEFKLGAVLQQAREGRGLTRGEVARRLHTSIAVISRIENHAGDMRLSTLRRYAKAIGTDLQIELTRGQSANSTENLASAN